MTPSREHPARKWRDLLRLMGWIAAAFAVYLGSSILDGDWSDVPVVGLIAALIVLLVGVLRTDGSAELSR